MPLCSISDMCSQRIPRDRGYRTPPTLQTPTFLRVRRFHAGPILDSRYRNSKRQVVVCQIRRRGPSNWQPHPQPGKKERTRTGRILELLETSVQVPVYIVIRIFVYDWLNYIHVYYAVVVSWGCQLENRKNFSSCRFRELESIYVIIRLPFLFSCSCFLSLGSLFTANSKHSLWTISTVYIGLISHVMPAHHRPWIPIASSGQLLQQYSLPPFSNFFVYILYWPDNIRPLLINSSSLTDD